MIRYLCLLRWSVLMGFLTAFWGCDKSDASCAVTDNEDGTYTLDCPDGKGVILQGADTDDSEEDDTDDSDIDDTDDDDDDDEDDEDEDDEDKA